MILALALGGCSTADAGAQDAGGRDAGRAATPASIVLDKMVVDFGDVPVGQPAPMSATFVVGNQGDAVAGVPYVAVVGPGFSLAATTCREALPGAGSCTATVTFRPTAVGPAMGVVSAASTPGGARTATLHGRGLP